MRSHHKSTNYVSASVPLFYISATIPNRKSEGTISNLGMNSGSKMKRTRQHKQHTATFDII